MAGEVIPMTTGELCFAAGILLMILAVVLFVILKIIFRIKKRTVEQQLKEKYDQ